MSTNFTLKIDGIKGENQLEGHVDEVEIYSWSWGLDQSGTLHQGSGGGAGKVDVNDLEIMKYVDAASADLMNACSKGTHIAKATLTCFKAAGDTPLDFMTIDLEPVMVTAVEPVGQPGAERLMERVRLNFGKVAFNYKVQDSKGGTKATKTYKWDVQKNKGS